MTISGPIFLAIYVVLCFAAYGLLTFIYRRMELLGPVKNLDFAQDPYQIAFLNKDSEETIYIVIVSLVDRGLLQEQAGRLHTRDETAIQYARRPIEQAILHYFIQPHYYYSALTETRILATCQAYQAQLEQKGLLAGKAISRRRLPPLLCIAGAMLGISLGRIFYAFAHGNSNVIFLIILTIVCLIALYAGAYRNRLTAQGEISLDRLRNLFADLKHRAKTLTAGGENNEAAILAAVYGLDILPVSQFPIVARMRPKSNDSSGDSGGSGGGGGDSGGGGCGGGCGGCG